MGKKFKHMPSPAMVIAVIAVVLALGGTAVAALSGKDKKKVRNIADQEITKKAPGLAVASAATAANASNASNAANAADAAKLGGVAPSGYQQGGGHTYFGTKSGANPSTGNALLNIPGIASITMDCAANGVDSTVHITNTSGVSLGDVGQNQATSASLNPFGPSIANGVTVDIVHTNSTGNGVADTVLMLWNAASGKVASIHISNVFCDYGATATTNQ
jgi:hypothetical protein